MKTLFLALPASDLAESRNFYETLLGLEVITEDQEAVMPFFEVLAGSLMIRIYEWKEEFNHRGHTGLHLQCVDLDGVHARLSKVEGIQLTEIRDERWGGRVCTVWDPMGNNLDLVDESSVNG